MKDFLFGWRECDLFYLHLELTNAVSLGMRRLAQAPTTQFQTPLYVPYVELDHQL